VTTADKEGEMAKAASNGIEIEYESFGDRSATPILLVMGLGGQMTAWDTEFCQDLAQRGYFVVRFDNRDVGLSTYFDELGLPDLLAVLGGDFSSAPYRLSDMAADAAGLLAALDIPAAHVVGVSMGGMIAQQLTMDYPDRVLSLCSIMSTTGDTTVGQPSQEALAVLLNPSPPDRGAFIDNEVVVWRTIGSPGFPFDEDRIRARAGAAFDRAYHPEGPARQLAAIVSSPDRTAALGKVVVPTLVIHGDGDILVNPSGGLATHAAVPGSELLMVKGMGHELPVPLWPEILEAVEKNISRSLP
jgi:pimeloyl-ACP methyl ester carboxylesterase